MAAPGSLSMAIDSPETVVSLSVEGIIDARDIRFIADSMKSIRHLDLTMTAIAAFGDEPAGHIPACAFAGCLLSAIAFPAECEISIGDMAFMDSGLTALDIPKSVTSIGTGAFAGCRDLNEVSISGETVMRDHAFADCMSLTRLCLMRVDSIPEAAFSACGKLAELTGEENLRHIGAKAFEGCQSLESFKFGSQLSYLGDGAFAHSGLTAVDLSECSMAGGLSPWVLAHCHSLQTVKLPVTAETIGEGALFDDSSLSELSLPDGVTDIFDVALSGASTLDSISMPSALESIGSLAMNRLESLSVLNAERLTSVPQLGDDVWSGVDCAAVRLLVADAMADDFSAASQWNEFNIVNAGGLSSARDAISDTPAVTYSIDGKHLTISSPLILKAVRICDIAGRVLAFALPGENEYNYEISPGHSVLLIETSTADGLTTSDKILTN